MGSNVTLVCPFKNFNYFEWHKNAEIFHNDDSKSTDIVFPNISTADQGTQQVLFEANEKFFFISEV